MKKIILLLMFLINSFTYAQRILPTNVTVGILKNYNHSNLYIVKQTNTILYTIKLYTTLTYKISPVCIIKNELDRFIFSTQLKSNVKKPIAYKLESNKVKYIWILTDSEYQKLMKKK